VRCSTLTSTTGYQSLAGRWSRSDFGGNDFLGLLMTARDEDTGAVISDARLRDELRLDRGARTPGRPPRVTRAYARAGTMRE